MRANSLHRESGSKFEFGEWTLGARTPHCSPGASSTLPSVNILKFVRKRENVDSPAASALDGLGGREVRVQYVRRRSVPSSWPAAANLFAGRGGRVAVAPVGIIGANPRRLPARFNSYRLRLRSFHGANRTASTCQQREGTRWIRAVGAGIGRRREMSPAGLRRRSEVAHCDRSRAVLPGDRRLCHIPDFWQSGRVQVN